MPGALSHPHNRNFPHDLLLHLRNPALLASSLPLPRLHHPFLHRANLRRPERPQPIPQISPHMEDLRLILPCPPPPRATPPPNKKIHLRLPPAWHNLARCLRCLRHRSPGLLKTLPRNHKHPAHPRRELPHPLLPRVCARHGPRQRLPRVLRKPADERRR